MDGYLLGAADLERILAAVRVVEGLPANLAAALGVQAAAADNRGRNRQTVKVTSGTPTGLVYPGQVALYEAGDDSYTLLGSAGDVWVRARNGNALDNGDCYDGEMWGARPDGKPVFLVDHCCGDALAVPDEPCSPTRPLRAFLDEGDPWAEADADLTPAGASYVLVFEGTDDRVYTFTLTWVADAAPADYRLTVTCAGETLGPQSPDEGAACSPFRLNFVFFPDGFSWMEGGFAVDVVDSA